MATNVSTLLIEQVKCLKKTFTQEEVRLLPFQSQFGYFLINIWHNLVSYSEYNYIPTIHNMTDKDKVTDQ